MASLFVEIRERLSLDILSGISDIVIAHSFEKLPVTTVDPPVKNKDVHTTNQPENKDTLKDTANNTAIIEAPSGVQKIESNPVIPNKGKLLMDATVAPQNITYPTDLKLLNTARKKSEELIDKLYEKNIHGIEKARTYREIARKDFLNAVRKKAKSGKEIYKANGTQIRYLRRNLQHITDLLLVYKEKKIKHPLQQKEIEYLYILDQVYHQQNSMHSTHTNKIENRIVNLHQPHVRPIVRGKQGKKVEFGSKLQVCLVDGFIHLDVLSWNNFNEGTSLMTSVGLYKKKYGFYPAEVLADQIYCTRENRGWLKEKNIKLMAKPLGRPSKEALQNPVSPGERNPIEGKFGQAKVGYGLANISAKLKTTSESWIAAIILVLNLVNLTRINALKSCLVLLVKLYRLFDKNLSLSC